MKIRRGFVSNSSSSSFVVALPKVPETVDELKNVLFGNEERYENPYDFSDRPVWYSTKKVAQTVFDDLMETGQATHSQLLDEIMYLRDGILYHDYENANGQADWDRYNVELRKVSLDMLEDLMDANEGCVLYVVDYSDDSVYGSALEHGKLFESIPHIRISKH